MLQGTPRCTVIIDKHPGPLRPPTRSYSETVHTQANTQKIHISEQMRLTRPSTAIEVDSYTSLSLSPTLCVTPFADKKLRPLTSPIIDHGMCTQERVLT